VALKIHSIPTLYVVDSDNSPSSASIYDVYTFQLLNDDVILLFRLSA
jgi:hypothetical protein